MSEPFLYDLKFNPYTQTIDSDTDKIDNFSWIPDGENMYYMSVKIGMKTSFHNTCIYIEIFRFLHTIYEGLCKHQVDDFCKYLIQAI